MPLMVAVSMFILVTMCYRGIMNDTERRKLRKRTSQEVQRLAAGITGDSNLSIIHLVIKQTKARYQYALCLVCPDILHELARLPNRVPLRPALRVDRIYTSFRSMNMAARPDNSRRMLFNLVKAVIASRLRVHDRYKETVSKDRDELRRGFG